MRASELAELVRATIAADVAGWDEPPVCVWFPDFESAELKAAGLTAVVIVPGQSTKLATRGKIVESEPMLHVAVTKPMVGTRDELFDDGAIVVDQAQGVVDALLGIRIAGDEPEHWAMCLKAEFEPIVAPEVAKQYALWCSYLKLSFKSGDYL
jgi:hypothetical protein